MKPPDLTLVSSRIAYPRAELVAVAEENSFDRFLIYGEDPKSDHRIKHWYFVGAEVKKRRTASIIQFTVSHDGTPQGIRYGQLFKKIAQYFANCYGNITMGTIRDEFDTALSVLCLDGDDPQELFYIIGMISLHTTTKQKDFATLWIHQALHLKTATPIIAAAMSKLFSTKK